MRNDDLINIFKVSVYTERETKEKPVDRTTKTNAKRCTSKIFN